jgi:DNA helicase IV
VPNLTVKNYHRLCSELAAQAGLSEAISDFNKCEPDKFAETLLDSVKLLPEEVFDAIVIDEGQDFDEIWIDSLEGILKDSKSGIFYVFFDDNQNIYNISSTLLNDNSYSLNENVRNTRSIFNLVSDFYKSDGVKIRSKGPSGRKIEIFDCKTREELISSLKKTLHLLINEEKVLPDQITVLSLKSIDKDNRSFLKDGDKIGNFVLSKNPVNKNEIKVTTTYSFKGLENQIIIATDIDETISRDEQRRNKLYYTAFSRARNHLILMGDTNVINKFFKK